MPRASHAAIARLLGLLLATSCAGAPSIVHGALASREPPPAARYQSVLPNVGAQNDLGRTVESVKRISTTALYTTYHFNQGSGLTARDLLHDDPVVRARALARAVTVVHESETKSGSAAVIAHGARRVALLTNDHVTRYPEVVFDYFGEARRGAEREVASVSFRDQQYGGVVDHPDHGEYRVVANDSTADIAILEVRVPSASELTAYPVLRLPRGDPRRLRWGSVVFAVGYPLGYRMVTQAIVSEPNRDRHGAFVTDGLWNEGISGGVIVAVREDGQGLEWVAMTRAGAGTTEVRLRPLPELDHEVTGSARLYDGPVFARSELRLHYGITLPVPMPAVRSFLRRHRRAVERAGFDLSDF